MWVIRTWEMAQEIARMRGSQRCDTDSNVWKNLFISKLTFCFLFVEDASPLIWLALSAVWWRRSYSEVCWNAVNRWKAQSGGLWLNSSRHSAMTRINKYSSRCNADSLRSICSPSGPRLPCWRMESKHDISWKIILSKWIKLSGCILHAPIYSVTFWKCWETWSLFIYLFIT